MNRRDVLKGLAGILASGVAPAYAGSKVLMPIKQLILPPSFQTATWSASAINMESQAGWEVMGDDAIFGLQETGSIMQTLNFLVRTASVEDDLKLQALLSEMPRTRKLLGANGP